jgi:uncharacterized protein (DUF169 family)
MTLPETMTQHDFVGLTETLSRAISLRLPPVAVCLVDELPSGVPAFAGRVAAGCRFWQEAATQAFATEAADHASCAIGTYTHNLASPSPQHDTDRSNALEAFASLGYVRPEDLPLIPVLARRPRYVVYAPLDKCPLKPDVVLLFVTAAQALVVAEAAQQVEGKIAPALGRPACAVVAEVTNGGRAALSLGCCGARAYLDVLSDDVSIWGLPGARLAEYVARISALAQANATLTQFHRLRDADVKSGRAPSVLESLERLRVSS